MRVAISRSGRSVEGGTGRVGASYLLEAQLEEAMRAVTRGGVEDRGSNREIGNHACMHTRAVAITPTSARTASIKERKYDKK